MSLLSNFVGLCKAFMLVGRVGVYAREPSAPLRSADTNIYLRGHYHVERVRLAHRSHSEQSWRAHPVGLSGGPAPREH